LKHLFTYRPAPFLRLSMATLAVCATLAAQYVDIVTHTDYRGLCGSPGHRGCALLPTCTDPGTNVLRDDKYTGEVNCNLPGASLGLNDGGSLPLILQQYRNGQITPSDTIFTSTDLHFGKGTFTDADHVRHLRYLNQFANLGMHWPRGIGFPDEAIHRPAALVTTGDDTHYGHGDQLGQYRLLYEQGLVNESTALPVLMGLGNHDADGDCGYNNCAKRMFDYEAAHMVGGVNNFDNGSDNYSWTWNGVHYVQLNKWAGDTKYGSSDTHASGLTWLINDLRTNVGISNRPVIVFQHFGVDGFSKSVTNGVADWWSTSDRSAFWNAIQGYNVIGMFTGHSHSTGINDFNEVGGHLDDFVGGTGGEDPCLNFKSNGTPCGGRGNFFAVRVTDKFLDVVSLEWVSNADGSDKSTVPYFTNLKDAVAVPNAYEQGPSFVSGQMGCRKLINSRIVDVSSLVNNVGSVSGSTSPIIVTNTSQTTIPGPLALKFSGMGDSVNLTSKSFVDRCSSAASGANIDTGGSSFMYPNDGYAGDLAPGASVKFTPIYAGSAPSTVNLKLVRTGLTKGASPFSVDLIGTPKNVPPPGTVTIYGPPGTPFAINTTIETATANWVAVTASANRFDQFGIATLTYTLNAPALLNDLIDATEIAFVNVTTANANDEVDVVISLHLRVADTIATTITPSNQIQPNQPAVVTAKITYVPVVEHENGGIFDATGVMVLKDITIPGTPVTLAQGFLNSNCANEDPNCPVQPHDTVIFSAVTMTGGVRTLQVFYSGDSFYAPNTSAPFQVAVGTPQASFVTLPGALSLVVDGTPVTTPFTANLAFQSSHTVTAKGTQSAAGTHYQFSGWDDGVKTNPRDFTVTTQSSKFVALYETQYLLNLIPNPLTSGTVATADAPADMYYPLGAVETLTATPNAGFYFAGFTGDFTSSHNGATFTMDKPKVIVASFSAQTAPAITWPSPADMLFGGALGPVQLNATANVPGTFVYSPPAGVVPPIGNGYNLNTTFTPTSLAYTPVSSSVKVNVLPTGVATLVITKTLTRDSATGNIVVQFTIANTGSASANNVTITKAQILNVNGSPLPVTIARIPANGIQQLTLNFPGTVGATGTPSLLSLGGTYSGGTISYSSRIVLP